MSEPYGLDATFEKIVLYYCSCSPKFWALVGHALDAECIEHPMGALVLKSCQQIVQSSGEGPDSTLIVIQRIRLRMTQGKATWNEINSVLSLYEEIEELPKIPDMQRVVDELVPVVRRKMQSNAILLSHEEYNRHGDFSSARDMLDRADALGKSEHVSGVRLGGAGFDRIEKSKNVDRLSTGVLELDIPLRGGVPKRTLSLWLGDSGGGKSQSLAHIAGVGLRHRLFVGFATLELPEAVQLARLSANITGIETDDILDVDSQRDKARARLEAVESQIGLCELADFPPHLTSVKDLEDWVDAKQDQHGLKMDLLVVDYADKLYAPFDRTNNEYIVMRHVYEGLRRDLAVDKDMWVWTASQAGRPGAKGKRSVIDLQDVADSMHKVRASDLVITLNPDEDEQMELFVAKNRLGRAKFKVGPLVTDFARARLVPPTRELGNW